MILQSVYWLSLLTIFYYALFEVQRHPKILLFYRQKSALFYLFFFLSLLCLSGVFMILSVVIGEGGSSTLRTSIVMGGVINLLVAAGVFPFAWHYDQTPRAFSPSKTIVLFEVLGLFIITPIWSYLSFYFLSMLFKAEAVENSIVDLIDTQGRLIEYISFCCFALFAAFAEEIIFRGGFQGLLEKRKLPVGFAITLPAFVFALGHAGYVEPWGVKELQIFGLGVIFGFAKYRHGLIVATSLHLINNLLALLGALIIPMTP